MVDYRKQAKADLVQWWKERVEPKVESGKRQLLAAGFTEEEANKIIVDALRNATTGLHGFGRTPE